MSNADDEDKKKILEKKSWKDALAKATGVKVKDNVTLLKRSMKRDEKKKSKSQTEWKDRVDKVDADKKGKQDQRRANIKQWKEDRKAGKKTGSKGSKAPKTKSPMRAGFEGKKKGFLNRGAKGGK